MEMLTNAEFYMSKKSDLNDPLDMAYTISLKSYLNLYFKKYPSLKNDPEHIERVSSCFKWSIEEGRNHWINDIDESQSKLRKKEWGRILIIIIRFKPLIIKMRPSVVAYGTNQHFVLTLQPDWGSADDPAQPVKGNVGPHNHA